MTQPSERSLNKKRLTIAFLILLLLLIFLFWKWPKETPRPLAVAPTPQLSPPPAPNVPRTDLDNLQGTWKRLPEKQPGIGWRYEVRGNELQLFQKHNDGTSSFGHNWCQFTLDQNASPRRIDVKKPQLNYGMEFGIYQRKGDHLKICFGATDSEHRPTEFLGLEQSNGKYQLWEFERETPATP